MDRILLRVPEAAEAAGISRSLAYQLIASGEMPSVRVGRSIRVPAEALRRWAEGLLRESDQEVAPELDASGRKSWRAEAP